MEVKMKVAGKFVVGVMSLFALNAFADTKIGYVDIQKGIQSTKIGQEAKKKFEKEIQDKRKELESKEAEIRKMDDELKKKSMVLTEEVKTKKIMERWRREHYAKNNHTKLFIVIKNLKQ
jgi:outer membrane protein